MEFDQLGKFGVLLWAFKGETKRDIFRPKRKHGLSGVIQLAIKRQKSVARMKKLSSKYGMLGGCGACLTIGAAAVHILYGKSATFGVKITQKVKKTTYFI